MYGGRGGGEEYRVLKRKCRSTFRFTQAFHTLPLLISFTCVHCARKNYAIVEIKTLTSTIPCHDLHSQSLKTKKT